MEYGFGLMLLNATSPIDGCQNVLIRNCTITGTSTTIGTFTGIMARMTQAGNNISRIPAAASDAHRNNKLYNNTIINSYNGINFVGRPSNTLESQNNDIGGNSAALGNRITNYWGDYGIYDGNSSSTNISNNTIVGTKAISTSANQHSIILAGSASITTPSTHTVNNNLITYSLNTNIGTYTVAGITADEFTHDIIAENNNITQNLNGNAGD